MAAPATSTEELVLVGMLPPSALDALLDLATGLAGARPEPHTLRTATWRVAPPPRTRRLPHASLLTTHTDARGCFLRRVTGYHVPDAADSPLARVVARTVVETPVEGPVDALLAKLGGVLVSRVLREGYRLPLVAEGSELRVTRAYACDAGGARADAPLALSPSAGGEQPWLVELIASTTTASMLAAAQYLDTFADNLVPLVALSKFEPRDHIREYEALHSR